MVNRCHSSFVHYNQIMQNHYSKHNCCGGGCGSIFTSHHHCGGGGFWGGVGAGLGLGFSNLLMGGIGMLGNWLMGGMGFGNFGIGFGNGFGNFGFGNFGFGNTGFWGLNGTEKAGSKKDSKSDKSDKSDKPETKTVENSDAAKITELQGKLATLADKISKKESVTQKDIDDLLAEVNTIKDDSLDGIQDDLDKKNLESLRKTLASLKPSDNNAETGDGAGAADAGDGTAGAGNGAAGAGNGAAGAGDGTAGAGNGAADAGNGTGAGADDLNIEASKWTNSAISENLKNYLTNIELPNGYNKVSNSDTINSVKRAHDASETTIDVEGASKVSKEKYGNTNFPLYIQIKTSSDNNYQYKCIGFESGYPVYATPSSDSNKNEYILVKNSNGEYELLQTNNKFSGFEKKDTQCG